MLVPGVPPPPPLSLLLPLLLPLLLCISTICAGRDEGCADCDNNGPWWPLFRPSQIIQSEFPEHQLGASARVGRQASASAELRVDGVARPGAIKTSAPGLDRLVGRGRHRMQWDHYGVNQRTQDAQVRERVEQEGSESQEGSFFNAGSFFDNPKPKEAFSKDFGESRESAEAVSNSLDSRELAARRRPATSYSSFRSVFAGFRPPERRDLLHPDIPSNDVFKYVYNPNPVSRSQHFNGHNMSQQYLVHESTSGERPFVPMYHPVYRYVQGNAPQEQVRRVAHDVHVQHVLPSRKPAKETFWKSKSDGMRDSYDFQKKDVFQMGSWRSKIHDFQDRQDGFSASPIDPFWKETEKGFQVHDVPAKTPLSESFWKYDSDNFQKRQDGFSASPVDPFWKEPGKEIQIHDDLPVKSIFSQSAKHEDFPVHRDTFSGDPSMRFLKDPKPNDEFKMDFELPSKDSFQDILSKESKHELSYVPTKGPFFEHFWKNKEFPFNHAGSTKIPFMKDHKKIDLLKPSGQTLFFFRKKPNVLDLKKSAFRRQGHGQNYAYMVKTDKRIVK